MISWVNQNWVIKSSFFPRAAKWAGAIECGSSKFPPTVQDETCLTPFLNEWTSADTLTAHLPLQSNHGWVAFDVMLVIFNDLILLWYKRFFNARGVALKRADETSTNYGQRGKFEFHGSWCLFNRVERFQVLEQQWSENKETGSTKLTAAIPLFPCNGKENMVHRWQYILPNVCTRIYGTVSMTTTIKMKMAPN